MSYNGYYVAFPRLRRGFDSRHPHHKRYHLCKLNFLFIVRSNPVELAKLTIYQLYAIMLAMSHEQPTPESATVEQLQPTSERIPDERITYFESNMPHHMQDKGIDTVGNEGVVFAPGQEQAAEGAASILTGVMRGNPSRYKGVELATPMISNPEFEGPIPVILFAGRSSDRLARDDLDSKGRFAMVEANDILEKVGSPLRLPVEGRMV